MDEFSKESLRIKVERSIASRHVLETLLKLFLSRGVSEFIRSDSRSSYATRWSKNRLHHSRKPMGKWFYRDRLQETLDQLLSLDSDIRDLLEDKEYTTDVEVAEEYIDLAK